MKHKYIRHSEVGFILWPAGHKLHHDHVALALEGFGRIVSAGFADLDFYGVHCYGHSDTLNIDSKSEDTELLELQLEID